VEQFLAAYRAAVVNLLPVLPTFRRDAPVRHAAVSGTSYHEVVFRLSLGQYRTMFARLAPADYLSCIKQHTELTGRELSADLIVGNWVKVAQALAALFSDPIDAEFLEAGIDTEAERGAMIGRGDAKYRSRPLTKAEIERCWTCGVNSSNPSQAVDRLVEDGKFAIEGKPNSKQWHVVDVRPFPESEQPVMLRKSEE
jgi:hypothetical protein